MSAALFSLSLCLVLAAYYLLKTVREALVLTHGGAEVKSYAAAGQSLLLLLVLPIFGWVANRTRGIRLVTGTYVFLAASLGVFFLLGRAGADMAVDFYLWLGVFSVITLALFWSYANDFFDEASGKRLFPYIGIGASVGGFLGARAAKALSGDMEAHTAMLVGAALVLASAGTLAFTRKFAVPRRSLPGTVGEAGEAENGFRLIASSRYLVLIAAMVVFTNVVNTTGEYMIGKSVLHASEAQPRELRKQFISAFYGDYYSFIGLAGMLIQSLAVVPIFRRIGAGWALLILPAIAISGYGAMAMIPAMWVIRAAKIAENSLDYSLQNTAKHALFLPTTAAVKYKAKVTIDSFFFRCGDILQAGVVMLGSGLAFTLADYARLNVLFAGMWMAVATATALEYRKLTARTVRSNLVPLPVSVHRAHADQPSGGRSGQETRHETGLRHRAAGWDRARAGLARRTA